MNRHTIKCPFCDSNLSGVYCSRKVPGKNVIKRYRKCEKCGNRFMTYEITAYEYDKYEKEKAEINKLKSALNFLTSWDALNDNFSNN